MAPTKSDLLKTTSSHGALQQPSSQTNVQDDDEEEDGDDVLGVEILPANPVTVTCRNKLICTTGFIILIIGLISYTIVLAIFQQSNIEIASISHFSGPITAIYAIFGSDILVSLIGIWSCLARTGPKVMIYTCIWLLLSTLFSLCVCVSLQFPNKTFTKTRKEICPRPDRDQVPVISDDCKYMFHLSIFLWCSLLLIVLKGTVIGLCRVNYPAVFNWLRGKQILVDEEFVNEAMKSLNGVEGVGGAYFDASDIQRLAARGSLGGNVLSGASSNVVLVTKAGVAGDGLDTGLGSQLSIHSIAANKRRKSRRATLISLSPY